MIVPLEVVILGKKLEDVASKVPAAVEANQTDLILGASEGGCEALS